ncbi:MAG: response regulator [Candidatus Omnitrophota bacterium]
MKKILVIDDEKDFVESVREFLAMRGYSVMVAYNGIDALEKMKASPDIVLLDIKMPGMDGFEFLRHINSDPDNVNTPVIMLTSKAETDSIFESKHLWAADYAIKPIKLEDLLALIRRYLDDSGKRPVEI